MSEEFQRAIGAADVADFLEKGLLENLVVLFRSDPSLYPLLGALVADERVVIRLGASALVESLAGEDPQHMENAAAALLPLLESENQVVRGDAAYLLGMVGGEESLGPLRALADDSSADVREAAAEAVQIIEERVRTRPTTRP